MTTEPATTESATTEPATTGPASTGPAPTMPATATDDTQPGSISRWAAAPALLIVAVFLGAPLVIIFLYSFLNRGKLGVGVNWSFSWVPYRSFLFREDFRGNLEFASSNLRILWYSTWLAGVTTALCLVLAVPAALWISQRPARQRNALVLAITIPFWTNVLVRTYAWILILSDSGLANRILRGTGLRTEPLTLLYTSFATQIGLVYTFLPFMVLPVYAALERFDVRLAEAAFDLGARRRTVIRRVILPTIKPGLIAGSILVFVPALGSFLQPDLLGGGKRMMMSNLIQQQFGASRNYPFGAALAFIIFAIVLVVLVIASLATRKRAVQLELL